MCQTERACRHLLRHGAGVFSFEGKRCHYLSDLVLTMQFFASTLRTHVCKFGVGKRAKTFSAPLSYFIALYT